MAVFNKISQIFLLPGTRGFLRLFAHTRNPNASLDCMYSSTFCRQNFKYDRQNFKYDLRTLLRLDKVGYCEYYTYRADAYTCATPTHTYIVCF